MKRKLIYVVIGLVIVMAVGDGILHHYFDRTDRTGESVITLKFSKVSPQTGFTSAIAIRTSSGLPMRMLRFIRHQQVPGLPAPMGRRNHCG